MEKGMRTGSATATLLALLLVCSCGPAADTPDQELDPRVFAHPHLATGLNNLAGIHLLEGEYRRAEPLFKKSLKIREATFGPDHRLVAAVVNSLAHVYRGMGKDARSERMRERYEMIADRQSTLEVPAGRAEQRFISSRR